MQQFNNSNQPKNSSIGPKKLAELGKAQPPLVFYDFSGIFSIHSIAAL